MSKLKLTPWISMKTPPVRVGVYEFSDDRQKPYVYAFGYWDGKQVRGPADDPSKIDRTWSRSMSLDDSSNYWRGLVSKDGK